MITHKQAAIYFRLGLAPPREEQRHLRRWEAVPKASKKCSLTGEQPPSGWFLKVDVGDGTHGVMGGRPCWHNMPPALVEGIRGTTPPTHPLNLLGDGS